MISEQNKNNLVDAMVFYLLPGLKRSTLTICIPGM